MKKIIICITLYAINNYSQETDNTQKVKTRQITIACNSQGYPKTKALKALVTALYKKQSSQEEITIKEVSGGYFTEKMYIIFSKKNGQETPLYFFKISNKTKSTNNLIKIQEGPITEKLNETKRSIANKNSLPEIILLENIFTYKDHEGNTKVIEVTPSAQGYLIKNILDSEDITSIRKCALELGKTLANFHKLFMNYKDSDNPSDWRTVCHRDFSIKNALFDPQANQVYFIDNESMDEAHIGVDIKTILVSMLMFYYIKKHNRTRWPLYLEYCETFLKGYIESYPAEQRTKIALFIKKVLNDEINKKINTVLITNRAFKGNEFHEAEFKQKIYSFLQKF